MKSKFYLLAILALAVACSVEDGSSCNEIKYPAEVSASIDIESATPETKVYADENLKVLWDNDDRISLFNKYTYNKEYRFAGRTGANSGTFQEVSTGDVVVGNELDDVYAVYPYQELTEISNSGVITLDLPARQSYEENSFGRRSNTMVSATTNTELLFKNLCGYLVLKLYGDGVTVSSISIKGNNNEVLAGTADVTAAVGSTPSLAFWPTGTSEELTLVCDTPVELGATSAEATVFWLVVPPITFTNGFSLTVTDPDGNSFKKSTASNIEIKRNRTFRMKALDVEGSKYNIIYYTSSTKEVIAPYKGDVFGATILSNDYVGEQGTIVFDSNVKSIGKYAFYMRSTLASIILPQSVSTIDDASFFCCSDLSSISIPESVISIGSSAFNMCTNLTSITIPSSVATIGKSAFRSCSGLKEITIPNIINIEDGTFFGCSSLTSFVIPDTVTSIGRDAFCGCSRLTSLAIPDNVTSIGEQAFMGCSTLTSISIPSKVTSIARALVAHCSNLISVTIPDKVDNIGELAFAECSNLKSIIIFAMNPPALGGDEVFYDTNNCPIYVPEESIYSYKKAEGWSSFADRIHGISEFQE